MWYDMKKMPTCLTYTSMYELWCKQEPIHTVLHGNLLKQEVKVSAAQVNLGLRIRKDMFEIFLCVLFIS